MNWNRASRRIEELEEKQTALLDEYNGITELIKEDMEEQDLDSFKGHVEDMIPLLEDLNAIKDELGLIGDMIDDASEDERGDW